MCAMQENLVEPKKLPSDWMRPWLALLGLGLRSLLGDMVKVSSRVRGSFRVKVRVNVSLTLIRSGVTSSVLL